jgi:hypothetical protein
MDAWVGPVLLTAGLISLVIAWRTDCKSEYWTVFGGHISNRELFFWIAGTIAVIVGLILVVAAP